MKLWPSVALFKKSDVSKTSDFYMAHSQFTIHNSQFTIHLALCRAL